MGEPAPSSRRYSRVALAIAAGAGLGCGYFARSAATGSGGSARLESTVIKESKSSRSRSPDSGTGSPSSADTPASLSALTNTADLYTRLALWLPQASAADCATFWESYSKRQTQADPEIANLLFARWAGLDPQAAIAAAKDTAYENASWAAWARHDPRAAISAARQSGKKWGPSMVLGAAARFHPDLAMKLLSENPDLNHHEALTAVALAWAEDQPERSLELLLQHDLSSGDQMVAGLTRRDPHAALAWLKDHPGKAYGLRGEFIKTLREENPAMLTELVGAAPSGALKRLLESAAFRHLASTDPDKALEMARATEAPRIADERLAMIASGKLDGQDPQGALAILEEIYTRRSDSAQSVRGASMQQLFASFVKADPAATMQVMARVDADATAVPNSYSISRPFNLAAAAWARSDLAAYTSWVEQQAEGVSRNRAARVLSDELMRQRRFPESMEWLGRIASQQPDAGLMDRVLGDWLKEDPQAARAWFDNASLSDDLAKRLSRRFQAQAQP